jgi:hypothetical protein
MNDWVSSFGEDELVELVLSVASGLPGKSALIGNFEINCKPLEQE